MIYPLRNYEKLKTYESLKPADILLFYNGNRVTEWVGRSIYKHRYVLPAFHAALVTARTPGEFINVGKFATLSKVPSFYRSSRRIDVIRYEELGNAQRHEVVQAGLNYLNRPYDVLGFLAFGHKLPVIGPLFKPFRGSSKLPYCSDHVYDSYMDSLAFKTAFEKDEMVAPWDLLEYAEDSDRPVKIYTLFEGGAEFKTYYNKLRKKFNV